MPKEYISNVLHAVDEESGEEVLLNTFKVRVGWNKEVGDVQIATVNEEADPFSCEGGLHVELNRRAINDLIRVLRKARDQAFGRDE